MATFRLCCCDPRLDAQLDAVFIYLPLRRAWAFTDGSYRSMSAKARYYALIDRSEFHHVDHTGEPFAWESCPWCGCDLPGVEMYFGPVTQADGEGAE